MDGWVWVFDWDLCAGLFYEHPFAMLIIMKYIDLNRTSWLLVGVRNHATDEVGLRLVEGGHQVVQLAFEVGGHSLATLALLPVLVLWSKESRLD